MCEILNQIENRGIEKCISQGISRCMALTHFLIVSNRLSDLKRATEDENYRDCLLKELFPE